MLFNVVAAKKRLLLGLSLNELPWWYEFDLIGWLVDG